MRQTKFLVVLAGAAMGFGAAAMAQTADQSRAYQDELLADSAGRTSLLGRATGNVVDVGAQFNFRFNVNARDSASPDEDTTMGFEGTRTKIWVQGEVAEDWFLTIVGAFDSEGGGFILEDAFGRYQADENMSFQFGQFKLPFLREESMNSARLLAADRSPTNSFFTQGRSQGVQLNYTADEFRFFAAFSDGFRTANTDFDSPMEADYAFTARGEWKWAGAWDRFDDFTSWQNSEMAGMVGGALHWQSGGSTGGRGMPTPDVDVLSLTADVSVEGDGWNGFASFVWQNVDAGANADFDDFGLVVQGGIFLDPRWELFGRYDGTFADSDRGPGVDDFHTITVGVNHYLIENSHAAKVTVDFVYFLDEQGSSVIAPSNRLVLLPSAEDGQWAIRGQLQLLLNP